ncbi:MAG: hypothetical protein ACD_5C00188G0003 [uncultured bacterium]|nr:MAG: hypothetical protein ACD_5C00188G0003 [uncultured bacterium]
MIHFLRKYLKCLGIILLGVLLYNIDYGLIREIFSRAETDLLIFAGLLNFLFIFVKSVRWYVIIISQKIEVSFLSAIKIYHAGSYFSIITPAKLGELIKIDFLREFCGIRHSSGFLFIIIDRVLDLIVLLTLFFFLSLKVYIADLFMAILVISSIFILIILSFFSRRIRTICRKYLLFVPFVERIPAEYRSKAEELWNLIKRSSPSGYFPAVLLTILSYCSLFGGSLALSKGLGLPLDFLEVAYCVTTANLVALIPISILGIGTRDLAMIMLFSNFGLEREAALTFSFGYLLLNLIFCHILGCFWFHQGKIRKA